MQISPEGTIHFPAHLLAQAGLSPLAELDISVEGGRLVVSSSPNIVVSDDEFIKRLSKHHIDTGLNADDIMRLTRGE